MDKLGAMNAFAKVVALGSFAEAARALGSTRSAVSKTVMELEHGLGVRLLDRTTRRVGATEAGLAYYERCVDILARVEETDLQVASLQAEPRGVLKVNGPTSFGALYLGPAVADFMAAYPDLRIELTVTDRFIDPIEEGVDVTIRIAELADSSLIARKLAPARRVFVASPSYLESLGAPETPEDLGRRACLTYGHTTTLQRWRIVRDGEAVMVPVQSVLCSNNGDVLRSAAVNGRGVAFLPTFLVGPDIAAGRLQTVLDRFPQPELGVHALTASNRYLAAKTRAFVDFLAKRFGDEPEWDRFQRA
ncbi:DNA-binding transcriptional LysR family regulator [Roseiarcus fermentans]|uniref:DNA-binding transcriptional LysR family regulator n=1 Tax=Roseiarcus fermentans TaxID=1473586 RepID=A0A366FV43_9HYPH|nr:LysR family transcriptional regulator [Roseiarcus fermentans]RBP17615.1 DNA-binding transcriptional LysR family regulator [Roseiarcus fermentans]